MVRKYFMLVTISSSLKLRINGMLNFPDSANTTGRNNLSIPIFQCNSHGSAIFRMRVLEFGHGYSLIQLTINKYHYE